MGVGKQMTNKMTPEAVIENTLIQQLKSGESQWKYREDLCTEEALWANFRENWRTIIKMF